MLSKADHIDDLESPVDKTDKVANLSPRAEIESHEEQRDKKKKTETVMKVVIRKKIVRK